MMSNDYGTYYNFISSRNPQANAIGKRVYQTIDNIITNLKMQGLNLGDENLLEGSLSSTMFVIRSTMHSNTQYAPSQLVFGKNAILNINHEASC